jgi:hypothetical protein
MALAILQTALTADAKTFQMLITLQRWAKDGPAPAQDQHQD